MHSRIVSMTFLLSLLAVLFQSGCKDEITTNDVLSDPSVMPRVIFNLPASGSDGPYELFAPAWGYSNLPHFILRFNKLMRISSIKPGSFRVTGFERPVEVNVYAEYYRVLDQLPKAPRTGSSASIFYDDLLAFVIRDSGNYGSAIYKIGQVISITLDSTIEDINGNHLRPYMFAYRPEPYFRVVATSPKNGDGDVGVSGYNVQISFNARIRNDILPSLSIDPSILGSWRVSEYDSSSVEFRPVGQFPFGTHFTASVAASAHDIDGNTLRAPYSTEFTTREFRVSASDPLGNRVPPAAYVWFACTGSIDTSTVRSAFTISPAVPGIFQMIGNTSEAAFLPSIGLTPNTGYTISISSGLRASNGTPLAVPYSSTFTTDSFRVAFTNPSDGSTNVSRNYSYISIGFNARINSSSATGAVTFTPAVAASRIISEGSSGNGGRIDFTLTSAMTARTTYTVTVSTAVQTKTGNNLPQPYTFSFTTGD